jgi:hypothetical protein
MKPEDLLEKINTVVNLKWRNEKYRN